MEQIAYGLLNPATGNLLRVETDVRADDYYGGAWYRFSESSSDPEWLVDDEQTARSAQWFPTTIGINSSLENPLTGRVPLADCQIVKVIKTVQIQPVESTNARPLRDCLDAREYTDYQNWENNNKKRGQLYRVLVMAETMLPRASVQVGDQFLREYNTTFDVVVAVVDAPPSFLNQHPNAYAIVFQG